MQKDERERIDRQLGIRLREMRLVAGMTQSDVAEQLGVSAQQVQKYETGRNRISVSRLLALATALQVTPQQLIPHELQHTAFLPPSSYHLKEPFVPTADNSLTLEMFQAFHRLPSHEHRASLVQVARLMGE